MVFWVTTATTENFFLVARFTGSAASGSFARRPRPRPDILLLLFCPFCLGWSESEFKLKP
jgi:hypothetical protein